MLANPQLGLSEDQGWWNITVRRVAPAQKIGPNLPKVQGLITGPEKPWYLTTPQHVESKSASLPSFFFTAGHFSAKWGGGGLPFQNRPFSPGQLPSLLLSL